MTTTHHPEAAYERRLRSNLWRGRLNFASLLDGFFQNIPLLNASRLDGTYRTPVDDTSIQYAASFNYDQRIIIDLDNIVA